MLRALRTLWKWLKIPAARWGLFIGIGGTSVFLLVFTEVVAYTNRMEFCLTCHSMETPFAEYQRSLHYKNTTGVQADCADCHVPRDYPAKLVAKIMAVKDVIGEIVGRVDTPEKYEAFKLTMANRVWAKMERTKSRECRECHDFQDMLDEEQGRRARRKHAQAAEEGGHCIQCHKGVAHELPRDYEG